MTAPEPQRRQPRREQWEIAEHGGIVVQKENNEIRTDAGPDHVLGPGYIKRRLRPPTACSQPSLSFLADQRLCDVANTPPESRIVGDHAVLV